MAIGDVYKLSVVGNFGLGQTFVNTFHYRQENFVLGAEAEDLANQWLTDVMPLYLPLLMSSSVVQTIEVRQVTGDPLTGFDLPVVQPGTIAGEQLPPQSAPLISWRTSVLGRRNRGRSYLPAPSEGTQTAGSLSAGYIATAEAFAVGVKQLLVLAVLQWQFVIYGKACPDCDPVRTENIIPVTSHIIRADIATQRRRRVGTGS